MKKLNKLFSKKGKAEGEPKPQYTVTNSTSLATMSTQELCGIIFKYDDEVKRLNGLVSSLTQEKEAVSASSLKAEEEVKLYKEHSESTQALAEGLGAEVKDLREVLQSKKAEVELLRGQLTTSEEVANNGKRDLECAQKRIQELEEQFRLLTPSSSSSPTDDSQQLRTEIARLTSQTRDFHRSEQQVKDLEVVRKALEAEVTKQTFLLESTKTQLAEARERCGEMERKRGEAELTSHKRMLEVEAMKGEASRFAFQRESLETEISNLKETVLSKDAKLDKKRKRCTQLKQHLLEVRTELQTARQDLEVRLRETQGQLTRTQEDLNQKLTFTENLGSLKTQQLERELADRTRDWQSAVTLAEERKKEAAEAEGRCAEMQQSGFALQQEVAALREQGEKQAKEVSKLQVMLEAAQKKREMARSEVIKLSQKLEQKPSPRRVDESSTSESPGGAVDMRFVSSLRRELEVIYKALMTCLMTSHQVPLPGDTKMGLLIDAETFGTVERRVNDAMMQAQEALDMPEIDVSGSPHSWSGRITHAMVSLKQSVTTKGPVKLFSCISAPTDRQNPTIVMKPRTVQGQKLVSGTGPRDKRPVDDEAGQGKRRGSVDNLNYKPL